MEFLSSIKKTKKTGTIYRNGNMLSDANKGITAITYNHLNLPTEVSINGNGNTGTIRYIYDATGVKQQKVISTGTITDYAGNYIYENNSLKFFNHPEGYVEPNGNKWKYVYQYKDHLGNIRLSYADNNGNGDIDAENEIIEENNYYPFGLEHKGYNNVVNGTEHPYKYNGKEHQQELGLDWYDYQARNYDPAIGRWFNPDPLAEEFTEWSPYTYAFNDPIRFIDPDGMAPDDIIIKGDKEFRNQAFANLQSLTDDKLEIDKNGKVTISETSCNSGCEVGGNLVSNLINNEDATVTIVETSGGNATKGGTASEANLKSDGTPGSGVKEVTVEFNPNKTTGGVDVNGSKERPTEIGLGHELIHSQNRIDGKRDPKSSGVRDPDRAKGKGTILSGEELNTRKSENKLRKERDVPLRKTKQ